MVYRDDKIRFKTVLCWGDNMDRVGDSLGALDHFGMVFHPFWDGIKVQICHYMTSKSYPY